MVTTLCNKFTVPLMNFLFTFCAGREYSSHRLGVGSNLIPEQLGSIEGRYRGERKGAIGI